MSSQRRSRVLVVCSIIFLTVASLSGSSAAQGNSENAHACQKGGWASLARAEDPDTPFANQDDCVSYGAQGGALVPAQESGPDFSISGGKSTTNVVFSAYDGIVSGTGFTPGSQVVVARYTYAGLTENLPLAFGSTAIDATGAFSSAAIYWWCFPYHEEGATTADLTVGDAAGVSSTETIDLVGYCAE
jgi:hypothetical protein